MAENYVYKKVKKISFGMLGPDFIKKMSAVKVVTPELYDREGYPVDGGLMDVRLGVIDPGLRCKTCGGKLKDCIGHFGHIELARPVIHSYYADIILMFLRSTCRECSRVLAFDKKIEEQLKDMEESEEESNEAVKKSIKGFRNVTKAAKKCPHCKAKQLTIKIEKPTTYLENDKRLSPTELRLRLDKISDADVELLGLNPKFARPEWMVLTIVPVPPVTIRPSITLESGERSEDDLTHKLGDIVKINQRLFENINAGAPEVIVEDLWDLLQYHVTTYFDNDVAQLPPARHRSGQPLKTLAERIKSKEGRFRHNLAGKRVNYAARTVISPDSKIELNEVGVPWEVAMDLTVPEMITEWNIKALKKYLENGPDIYPGANYVIRPDGKKKRITEETHQQLIEELQPGYIIERHLIDGDIAIFNRQPSLHRMSIMAHRIKVIPGKSFRINPAVCVSGDTKILLSSSIQRPIEELRNCWKESELLTYDWKNKSLKSTELKKFWALKPKEYNIQCYKIITKETGREVIATEDHPFYTNEGVIATKNLKINDKVIVKPIDTPVYKEIDKIIVSEDDIIGLAPKETYIKHTLKELKKRDLLPLNLKDQRVMILSRLLGHLFGDGTFILKEDISRLIFRGDKLDLEDIQEDIKRLGFKPEIIRTKITKGKIHSADGTSHDIHGTGLDFEIRNKSLGILFKALGAPNGDKVVSNYSIPKWILESPPHIKREFIAAYFGSELTKPTLCKTSKFLFGTSSFRVPVFKIAKTKKTLNFGLKFIKDSEKLLKEFNIKIASVSKEPGNIRKDGTESIILVTRLGVDLKTQLNLYGKIGYIYHREKDNKARLVYQYLKLKENELKKQKINYSNFFRLRKSGYSFKEISKKLNVSLGTLENWAYRVHKAGLPTSFPDFTIWAKNSTENLNNGLVWESIMEIENVECPFVYDITTVTTTHNFFANGFLTKNCAPYNADFDGDEMNLHIPQTEEARAEAEILMEVPTQIISPKNGLNVIGCGADAVTGNYLLTKYLEFDKEEAIQMLNSIGVNNTKKFEKFKNKVNGKEIFSALLPDDFSFVNYSTKCEKCEKQKKPKCDDDLCVMIRNGNLISGAIDKKMIGNNNGLIIRALYARYKEKIGIEILGKIFRLGIEAFLRNGFSVGISDTDLNSEVAAKCKETIYNAERRVAQLIEQYEKKELESLPGMTEEETLETNIMQTLNKARNRIGEIIAENSNEKDNPTVMMMLSGGGGSLLALSQMAACVGQQALGGKRVSNGYKGRTLSLFKKGDKSPKARGFIKSGYKDGLDPIDFFLHATTGRDSLMDTALRTPKSGYLYRRLSSALQDLKVSYDNTVRDANENIVQFVYGEDGLDVSKTEGGKLNIKRIAHEVLK